MKKGKDFGKIEDWLKIARLDWQRARRNLKENDLPLAGFFLQQCLEKYIKAFLLIHGWHLKKIHELDALLDEAIKFNTELKRFYKLCERVTGYYFADRYPPFDDLGLTIADIESDMAEAKSFIRALFPKEELDDQK
jgi:HEPN domain-containing protein